MGSSAYACLAWGIDFGDADNGEGFDFAGHDLDTWEMEEQFPALFGFTEEPPGAPDCDAITLAERRSWFTGFREPYNKRLEAAVPLDFRSYGYELRGNALILKRSLTRVEWGAAEVGRATLAEPAPAELEAFGKVWERWAIDWPQNVRLLLMASYG
jgi:hypothetical protein